MAFRSGFATLVGRPNAGKSTLVNRLVGTKVAITSSRPQTTRSTVRGVRDTPTSQLVLLDTPGLHRARTPLGERTNARARDALPDVDVIGLVVDATAPVGRGDRYVADLVHDAGPPCLLVVNKTDVASPATVAAQLAAARDELGDFDAYVPCSARTGEQVDVLAAELEARLPDGPRYYPAGTVTDQPETFLAAELVREQLLRHAARGAAALHRGHRRGARPRPAGEAGRPAAPRRRAGRTGLAERDRHRPARRGPQSRGQCRPPRSSKGSSAPGSTWRPESGSIRTGSAVPTRSIGSASDQAEHPPHKLPHDARPRIDCAGEPTWPPGRRDLGSGSVTKA